MSCLGYISNFEEPYIYKPIGDKTGRNYNINRYQIKKKIMAKEHVFSVVKNVISEVLPDVSPEQITITKNLKELGANSIDRMEVITMSMENLGLKLPLMSFAQVSNIEGLVEVLTGNYLETGK